MRLARPARGVAVLILAALMAAGCGSGASAPTAPGAGATRVVQADNGDVTIPVKPLRVVATGYAVPTLIEAGAPLVGISAFARGLPMMSAEQKKQYEALPRVAGEQAAETNYEAIAKLQPDLIVLGVPKPALGDIDLKRLQSVAPVVAIGPSIPSQWRELTRRQADAAGALTGFDVARTAYEQKAAGLKQKYAAVLSPLKFGHVGAYGQIAQGTFQREFNGSWGTNIAQDAGVNYYGEVKVKGAGSRTVSEYPSVEEIPASLGQADAISYSVNPDGSVPESVQRVLDSSLWKNLPAVKAGKTFAYRFTEAATYGEAVLTLDAVDQALAPLLPQ